MTREKETNVKGFYNQLILSGCESYMASQEPDNESASRMQADEGADFSWDKESYIVFIPFIVNEISVSDSGNGYTLQVHPNVNVFITAEPKRGKATIKQAVSVTLKKARKTVKIPMVSRISGKRESTFSFADGYIIFEGVSHIFGSTMDAINATVQRIILNSGRSKEIALFGRSGVERASTRTGIRTNKTRGGSQKIRAEILPKNETENTSTLAEIDGPVLGNGSRNSEISF